MRLTRRARVNSVEFVAVRRKIFQGIGLYELKRIPRLRPMVNAHDLIESG